MRSDILSKCTALRQEFPDLYITVGCASGRAAAVCSACVGTYDLVWLSCACVAVFKCRVVGTGYSRIGWHELSGFGERPWLAEEGHRVGVLVRGVGMGRWVGAEDFLGVDLD